jgi:hypothetical protein
VFGGGRCGGIEETNLISLRSEERRARPHMGRAYRAKGASPSASAPHQRPPSRSSSLDPAHDEIDAAGPSFPRIALSVCIPGGNSSFQPK